MPSSRLPSSPCSLSSTSLHAAMSKALDIDEKIVKLLNSTVADWDVQREIRSSVLRDLEKESCAQGISGWFYWCWSQKHHGYNSVCWYEAEQFGISFAKSHTDIAFRSIRQRFRLLGVVSILRWLKRHSWTKLQKDWKIEELQVSIAPSQQSGHE